MGCGLGENGRCVLDLRQAHEGSLNQINGGNLPQLASGDYSELTVEMRLPTPRCKSTNP